MFHEAPFNEAPDAHDLRVPLRPAHAPTAVLAAAGFLALLFGLLFGLSAGCGKAEPTHVLLVILDTTRADVVSPYGGRAKMPVLESLAANGLLFESATAQSPFTLGSVATILTSLGPDLHGIRGHLGYALAPEAVTLAEVLQASGYASAAFVSAVPLRSETGIGQGFDHFDDDLSGPYATFQPQFRDAQGFRGVQRRGLETVERAVAWLDRDWKREQPFFVAVHLFDAHGPHDPAPAFLQQYPDNPYVGEVASTDPMIGELLAALERLGARENTVVSVVSNHGEAFLEHGEVGHGTFLYETTMHVPWILSGPRVPIGRVQGLARLIDVAPTLLAACGVEPPPSFEGVDLLGEVTRSGPSIRTRDGASPPARDGASLPARDGASPRSPGEVAQTAGHGPYFELAGRPAYLETYSMRFAHGWSEVIGWREGSWKFVKAPRPELYDLGIDPGEEQSLLATQTDRAAAMERAMMDHLGRSSPHRLDARAPAPGEETAARLARLGYTGSPSTDAAGARPGWEIGLPDPKDAVHSFSQKQQAQAALGAAVSSLAMQDFAAALDWAGRALDLDPEAHEALATQGRALAALGRVPEAIDVYRAALERLPEDADLWQAYGVAEDQIGDSAEARRAYERALTIDPQHGRANLFLGFHHVRAGRMREALPYYQLAVLADPSNVPTLMELARVFFQLDELANARRVLEQVLIVDKESPEGLLMLGQVCQKMGDTAATKAALEAFVRIHPQHPETPRIRGILERL